MQKVACFDAVRLFIFVPILYTLQPHLTLWLSARTLQCLFVWGCACHNVYALYLALTSLKNSVPLCKCSSVVPSEQIVLRMRVQTWGSASNAVTKRSVKQGSSPVSSKISNLLFFVSYFASQSKGIKFGDYFLMCVVWIKTFWLDVRYPQQATLRE